MPGNPLTASERLRSGAATGALLLVVGDLRFRACKGFNGRGLVVAVDVAKGAALCRLPGALVESAAPPPGREVFRAREGRWLVLDPPTAEAPGNLVNTSAGKAVDGGNNAVLVYKPGTAFVTLKTTRALASGTEVLAAYGGGYTRELRKRAAEGAAAEAAERARRPHPLSAVTCEACGASMRQRDAARHRRGMACRARPNPRVSAAAPVAPILT